MKKLVVIMTLLLYVSLVGCTNSKNSLDDNIGEQITEILNSNENKEKKLEKVEKAIAKVFY